MVETGLAVAAVLSPLSTTARHHAPSCPFMPLHAPSCPLLTDRLPVQRHSWEEGCMLPARWLYPPYTCAMGCPIGPSTLLRSNRSPRTLSCPDSQALDQCKEPNPLSPGAHCEQPMRRSRYRILPSLTSSAALARQTATSPFLCQSNQSTEQPCSTV
jgi:hypothetical protein